MIKKKIFCIHLFNDYSGSPLILRNMVQSIDGIDTDINILTSNTDGFLSKIKNCKYTYIPYRYSKNKFLTLFNFILSQLFLFIRLSIALIYNKIKKNQSTVIINTMLPFAGSLAGFLFANKTIYYLHETHVKPNILKKILIFHISHFSNEVIYVSNYTKEALNIKKKGIVLFNPLRNDFELNPKLDFWQKHQNRNVLFSGSLKEYKGIYNFISIAKNCPNINFIAALNCDENEFNLFRESYKNIHNIKFYHRPDFIRSLYEKSFIILNLSVPKYWIETFGLSVLEGIAYGCVPIVPPIGGPLEIIKPNFGYSVHSNDIKAISEIILELSSDYTKWYTKSVFAIERSLNFSFIEYKKSINQILGV